MLRRVATALFSLHLLSPMQADAVSRSERAVLDASIIRELRHDGDLVERPHARVFSERGALPDEVLTTFADHANLAVAGIRSYLGEDLELRGGNNAQVIEFYLSDRAGISHASRSQPRAFIVPSRVANRSAPYAHEAVHAMAAWSSRAQWISEGFANHVAAGVVARVGGYYFVPVEPRGLASVKEHAASEFGQAVLPLVGAPGSREAVAAEHAELTGKIARERRTYAAAFYVLSWSFVDYLVSQVGVSGLRSIAEAEGDDRQVEQSTGRTLRDWRSAWLATME